LSTEYFIGVDLGQAQDFTAIAIVEHKSVSRFGEFDPNTLLPAKDESWNLRHLERPSLGTGYPEIVDRIKWLVSNSPLKENSSRLLSFA